MPRYISAIKMTFDEADIVFGLNGNDSLSGGAGVDIMQGGTGNDRNFVDSINDRVDEYLADGIDEVVSSVSFNLTDDDGIHVIGDFENLTLTVCTECGRAKQIDRCERANKEDRFSHREGERAALICIL